MKTHVCQDSVDYVHFTTKILKEINYLLKHPFSFRDCDEVAELCKIFVLSKVAKTDIHFQKTVLRSPSSLLKWDRPLVGRKGGGAFRLL